MQIYNYRPYPRIAFLAFTVLFHLFLLIRAAADDRYIMAGLLVIPVVGVSVALIKFLKKAVITISIEDSKAELATFYEKIDSNLGELNIEGKKLVVTGREFVINPSKAEKLREVLGNDK